jgi:hypothetical protein
VYEVQALVKHTPQQAKDIFDIQQGFIRALKW